MKPFDQKFVTERFVKLPEKVKDVILSDTTTESIRTLTDSIGLQGDVKKECIQQITLVATGLSTTKDFKEYITTELQIENEKAVIFFEGVVQNVFSPVREALLNSLGKKTETVLTEEAQKKPPTENETVRGTDPYKEQLI